jgi:chromosome segregation ATPase
MEACTAQKVRSDREGIYSASHGIVSDQWHSISKSIALLASAIVAKAVIDIGLSYIAVMCCIVAFAMMYLWSVRLKMHLSHQKHKSSEALRAIQRDIAEARQSKCEAGTALENALFDLSLMDIEQQKTRDKLDKTVSDLDSACCKISSLEDNSRAQQNDELEEARSQVTEFRTELAKTLSELVEAKSRMASLQTERNNDLEQANSKVTYLESELAKAEGELAEAKSIMAFLQTERNNELEQANSKVTYLGTELAKVEGELAEAKSIMAFLQAEECPTPKRHRCSY